MIIPNVLEEIAYTISNTGIANHNVTKISNNDHRASMYGKRKNYMRNKLCPCGSNKKFKNCCWSKERKIKR